MTKEQHDRWENIYNKICDRELFDRIYKEEIKKDKDNDKQS